jgi:hypothetical protein
MKNLLSSVRHRFERLAARPQPSATSELDQAGKLTNALEKLQGRDRVGVAGEASLVVGGAVAGAAVSSTVAGVAGATTLLGSTSAAGILGGVFVTTTPLGWVVGSAAAAGMIGYGLVKMVQSGSKQDRVREQYAQVFSAQLAALNPTQHSPEQGNFDTLLCRAVSCGALEDAAALRLASLVKDGRLPETVATQRLTALLARYPF